MHSVGSHKKDNIFPLSSEFYDKSGEPDKNRDRLQIGSGGLECQKTPFSLWTMENFWLESELQMWTIGPD